MASTSRATSSTMNPISGPIPSGFSSSGTRYTPASRRTRSTAGLADLRRDINSRPFRDVNLTPPPTLQRPTVQGPNRADYGTTDTRALNAIGKDVKRSRGEFYNPTGSDAFRNLMDLASTRTSRAAEEQSRLSQEAVGRRGYVGGYSAESERASRDRMREMAATGFEGAAKIREQAGGLLATQTGAYASLAGTLEGLSTQRAVQYAKDLAASRELQGQLDLGYGGQLVDLYGAHNKALLDQGALRETARGNDLDALSNLARMSIEDWQGQNELALLQEKYRLEDLSLTKAEQRRREAAQWDYAFGEKNADADRERRFKDTVAQDPRSRYLAGGGLLAQMALKRKRSAYNF